MKIKCIGILTLIILSWATSLHAQAKYRFKVASLAPEGSVWVSHFRDFANEVSEKTDGEVSIRIYPGGVMGDDLAMYRKIRAGQLHGGGFTMTGISRAVPDFRVMAIPFTFSDYDEIDNVSTQLTPYFKEKFHQAGLEFLALTEVGLIYGMSTAPTSTIADLRQRKSWIPSGDPVTAVYLKTLNITPVPLTIPDVLSSLQTGLIDTVYTSLYGTIVMQWFTKASYITDIPYGYAYGAVVFSSKAMAKLPDNYAAAMREAAESHFAALNRTTRRTNAESRGVLQNNGVSFIESSSEARHILAANREEAVAGLLGEAFSEEAYSRMTTAINQYRTKP